MGLSGWAVISSTKASLHSFSEAIVVRTFSDPALAGLESGSGAQRPLATSAAQTSIVSIVLSNKCAARAANMITDSPSRCWGIGQGFSGRDFCQSMSSGEKRHGKSISAARTMVGGKCRLGSAPRWTCKSMAPSVIARQRSRFASLSDIPDATRRLSASPIGSHSGVYATISIILLACTRSGRAILPVRQVRP
jgi:hypothetical protein